MNNMDKREKQQAKNEREVWVGELIAPVFYRVHEQIQRQAGEYILTGGRGSGKSSFVAVEIILLLLKTPRMNAVVLRRVGNTLRQSVFSQINWAIEKMGLERRYRCTVSPMEITDLVSGQKIVFLGMDDPGKIKSLKTQYGYTGLLWLEEMDQFTPEQVRSAEQTVLRGEGPFYCFKSFNPPVMPGHWANQMVLRPKMGRVVHHSTYRELPKEWLGEKFVDDALFLSQVYPRAYRHEYLGIATGYGNNVFENIKAVEIPKTQMERFDRILAGVDWGYYPDPWAFNRVHYDAARMTLYIFDELRLYKAGNRQTAERIKQIGMGEDELITADSAEPKSVRDYREEGLFCRGAKKGPDSVGYSLKWLQGLKQIVIDPVRCPNTLKEFMQYSYEVGKNGEVQPGYPDKDNHHIDAVRYATEPIWRRKGNG